jgi:hypothetical protein
LGGWGLKFDQCLRERRQNTQRYLVENTFVQGLRCWILEGTIQ